jgi:hypothetical protein
MHLDAGGCSVPRRVPDAAWRTGGGEHYGMERPPATVVR